MGGDKIAQAARLSHSVDFQPSTSRLPFNGFATVPACSATIRRRRDFSRALLAIDGYTEVNADILISGLPTIQVLSSVGPNRNAADGYCYIALASQVP